MKDQRKLEVVANIDLPPNPHQPMYDAWQKAADSLMKIAVKDLESDPWFCNLEEGTTPDDIINRLRERFWWQAAIDYAELSIHTLPDMDECEIQHVDYFAVGWLVFNCTEADYYEWPCTHKKLDSALKWWWHLSYCWGLEFISDYV